MLVGVVVGLGVASAYFLARRAAFLCSLTPASEAYIRGRPCFSSATEVDTTESITHKCKLDARDNVLL